MTAKRKFWPALAGFGIGYLYICCFLGGFTRYDSPKEWYPLLFAAVYLLWGNAIAGKTRPANQEGCLWLGVMVLIALSLALHRCRAVEGWGILALHGAAGLWGLSRMGQSSGLETPEEFLWDGVQSFLVFPFWKFFLGLQHLWGGLKNLGGERKKRRELLLIALCLLLALPLLSFTAGLLAQADPGFEKLMESIRGFFTWKSPAWLADQLLKLLFGLPVGAYLYGLLAGAAERETPLWNRQNGEARWERLRILPGAAAAAVWGAFGALYVLFFLVQAGNLFAVFQGRVPGSLTASAYARGGFFQLCLVMSINFLLLWLGWRLAMPTKLGKWLAALLMAESIFLAVTAGAKLLLYIHRFGFTPLRLLSAWAVLVLTAGCVFALLNLAGKQHTFRNWLYLAAATFTALCFY